MQLAAETCHNVLGCYRLPHVHFYWACAALLNMQQQQGEGMMKSATASHASGGSSPREQGRVLLMQDLVLYRCASPWHESSWC